MTSTDESQSTNSISDEDVLSSLQVLQEEYNQNPFVKTEGDNENKFPKEGVQALFCLYLTLACDPFDPDPKNLPHVGMDERCTFFYKASSGKKRRDVNFIDYIKVVLYKELPFDTFRSDLQKQNLSYKNYVMKLTKKIHDFLSDNKRLPIVLRVMKNHFGDDFKLTWIKDQPVSAPAPEAANAQGTRTKRKAVLRELHVEADSSEAAPADPEPLPDTDTGSKPACRNATMAHLTTKELEKLNRYLRYEYDHVISDQIRLRNTRKAYISDRVKFFRTVWHIHKDHVLQWDAEKPYSIDFGRGFYPADARAASAARKSTKETFPEELREKLEAYADHTFKTLENEGKMYSIDPVEWKKEKAAHIIKTWPRLKNMLIDWEQLESEDNAIKNKSEDQGSDKNKKVAHEETGSDKNDRDEAGKEQSSRESDHGPSQDESESDSDQGQDFASKDQASSGESEGTTPRSAADPDPDYREDSEESDVPPKRNRKRAVREDNAPAKRKRAVREDDAPAKRKRKRIKQNEHSDDDVPLVQVKERKSENKKQLASKPTHSSPGSHKKRPATALSQASASESEPAEPEPDLGEPEAAPAELEIDADAGGLFASQPQEERLEDLLKKANEGTLASHCKAFKKLFLHDQTKIKKPPSKVVKGVDKTSADTATRELIHSIQESRGKFAAADFDFLNDTFQVVWNEEHLTTTLYDYQRSAVKEALGIVQDVGSVIISGEPSWGKTVASAALVLLLRVKHCVIFCTNATMDQWHKDVSRFNTQGRLRIQKLDAGKNPSDLRLDMAHAEAQATENVITFWLAHHGVLGDSKRSNNVIFLFKEVDCAFVCDEPQEYLRNATSSSCNAHALLRNGLSFRESKHYAILATATPTVKIEEAQHYLSRVLYLPKLPMSLLHNTVEAKRNCGKVLSMLRVPDPTAQDYAGVKYPPCAVYDFILEKPPPLKQKKQAEVSKALQLAAQSDDEESEGPRAKSRKAHGLEMSAQAAAYRSGCGYHCTEFPPALMALVAGLSLLQRGLTGVIFTENKQLIREMKAEVQAMEPEHDDLKGRVFYVDGDLDGERRAEEMEKYVASAKSGGALCITTLGCNKSGTNKFQQADARFMFLAGEICPDAETLHQAVCRIRRQHQENAVMVVKFTCTDEYSQSMGVLSARKQVENASATWRKYNFHELYKEGRTFLKGKGTARKGKLQPVMEAEYLVSCILALYELLSKEKIVLHCENLPFQLNPNSPVKPVDRQHKDGGELNEEDKDQVTRYIDDTKSCLRLAYKKSGRESEDVQTSKVAQPDAEAEADEAQRQEAAQVSAVAPEHAGVGINAGGQSQSDKSWDEEMAEAGNLVVSTQTP
jgi:hypothetical protein